MTRTPTRVYTLVAGLLLLLQGTSTLAFRLSPPLDRAFPALLEVTQMVPSHSLLHIVSALAAFWALWGAGPRGTYWFALVFGLGYVGLAVAGWVSGMHLGLGLQPFDHPFHVVVGMLGLLAAFFDRGRHRKSRGGAYDQ